MKLRFDMAEKLTPEMVMESVLANNRRYKAEPLLSKTGTGSLSSASTTERAREVERSTALIQKLQQRAQARGRQHR